MRAHRARGGAVMRRCGALPELLAPAGSFDALVAAIKAGADAVYVGGKSFGARAYAKNFSDEELMRAAVYSRLHGVRLYVTVNTLVFDREVDELSKYAMLLRRVKPDAVIMADLGAIRIFRKIAPELEIHASTQMSVHNLAGADEAARLGCKRVVLARELPLSDISIVTEKSLAEIEIFLHGALCVSHSGQCLMSSLVGGRSGNRGECAQPCRLPYNGKYPLSLKDLSLAEHIPELIESGVSSLKIEGRMKSPEYVYTVTSIYRRLLDEGRCANADELEALARAFSRDGFTDGYFVGRKTSPMTGVRSESDKKVSRELEFANTAPEKIALRARAYFKLGEPSRFELIMGDRSVSVSGDVPSLAESSPLLVSSLKTRLSKMGNTFFTLSPDDIELQLEDGINLSPGAINELRRRAVHELEGGVGELSEIALPLLDKRIPKRMNTALFFNTDTLLACKPEDLSFFDTVFAPLREYSRVSDLVSGIYLPPVVMEHEWQEFSDLLRRAKDLGAKYALVGNISQLSAVSGLGLLPIGDFRLNVTNSYSRITLYELGAEDIILSPEITLPMARDIGGGAIVAGRIPLMLTERCFIKENFGCKSYGRAALTDRTGAKFPILRESGHRNVIFNSTLTYMGDKRAELDAAGIGIRHFIFSTEDSRAVSSIIRAYRRKESISGVRRIGKR